MVSHSCGDQSTTNVLRLELDYSAEHIFVVFILGEGFIELVPS